MAIDVAITPRLPTTKIPDGQQVSDNHGNIYEYSAEKNTWVYKGIIECPNVVTEDKKGLVSPSLNRKLETIQNLKKDGYDFGNFKLFNKQERNPYFYLFHSSDGLIRFSPEIVTEPSVLRLWSNVRSFFNHDGITIITPFDLPMIPGQMVGDRIDFLSGPSRRQSFIIQSNSADSIVISGNIDVGIDDIFKVFTFVKETKRLRLEVDRNKLYNTLIKNCCVGPKGDKGDTGFSGKSGIPADFEKFKIPQIASDTTLIIDDFVQAPIDTPISLRLFRIEEQIVEILVDVETSDSTITLIDDTLEVEDSSIMISYDKTSGKFDVEIRFTAGADDIDIWNYKLRQKGPKGAAGSDGRNFFEITQQFLTDPTARSSEAVISMRKSNVDDTIFFTSATLFDEVCTPNLAIGGSFPTGDFKNTNLVALQMTTTDCKDIGKFQFAEPEFTIPTLLLPLWTPTGDCVEFRRRFTYNFDWYAILEEDVVPFRIFPNPLPPEQCCADEFFFCPNVGDETCGMDIVSDPVVPEGLFQPECPCQDPLEFARQGGMIELPPISEGESAQIEGIINGLVDRFIQKVSVTGTTLNAKIESSSACPESEFAVSDCPVEVQYTLVGECGVDNPIQQSATIPGEVNFEISSGGNQCDLTLTIDVNTSQTNCCKGYKLTTTLTPTAPPTPPTPPGTNPSQPPPPGSNPSGPDSSGGGDKSGHGRKWAMVRPVPKDPVLEMIGPPPEPPVVEPPVIGDVKKTAVIDSVQITTGNSTIITGMHFIYNNKAVVTEVLWYDVDNSLISSFANVVNDTTITTSAPVIINPGSDIRLILALNCPPGLSNEYVITIPGPVGPIDPCAGLPAVVTLDGLDGFGGWTVITGTGSIVPGVCEGSGMFEIVGAPGPPDNVARFSITAPDVLPGFVGPPWDFSCFDRMGLFFAFEAPLIPFATTFQQLLLTDIDGNSAIYFPISSPPPFAGTPTGGTPTSCGSFVPGSMGLIDFNLPSPDSLSPGPPIDLTQITFIDVFATSSWDGITPRKFWFDGLQVFKI